MVSVKSGCLYSEFRVFPTHKGTLNSKISRVLSQRDGTEYILLPCMLRAPMDCNDKAYLQFVAYPRQDKQLARQSHNIV